MLISWVKKGMVLSDTKVSIIKPKKKDTLLHSETLIKDK